METNFLLHKFSYHEHAEEVRRWGKKHAFPLPPEQMLPDTGFIVNEIACGFLYVTNSSLGWIEWVFSNPEKTKEERAEGLDLVFKAVQKLSKELGIQALFSAAATKAYANVLERNGFNETDKSVTHYLKILGGD
jgi:hypothetical protein